jgi:hypothetical protein
MACGHQDCHRFAYGAPYPEKDGGEETILCRRQQDSID